MAPTADTSLNGDGFRISSSASAPQLGRGKVSIMIDPTAPLREGHDDTDMLLLPESSVQRNAANKAAWGGSSPTSASPSRPGSRQCSRFSLSSAGSSRAHSASRFSNDELVCFRRVPTPSNAYDNKRETYWDTGGSGECRRRLMNENWHTLPVLKGKFYSHPRLSDSVSHLSAEKNREKKSHMRRRNELHNQRPENLADEALTSSLLDEIFPRSPAALQRERERDFSVHHDTSGDASPSTPTSEGVRRLQRSRAGTAASVILSNKRQSLADSKYQDSTGRMELGMVDQPMTTTHSSTMNLTMSQPSTTRFGDSTGMLGNTGGASPASREALAAAQRRDTMLEFRKQIFVNFNTIQEAFNSFEREFPRDREMTKKEWRRVLVKLGFEATIEERDAIFDQLDINNNGHVAMMEFHIAIEAAAPVKTMEDLRRRWLASGYASMAQAFHEMEEGMPPRQRLTLREFGDLLSRVHVTDHAEHLALFNAISDQSENPRTVKVSIGELAAALATVCPASHLEEIRHRLLKRYNGNMENAFWDIDGDHSGIVSRGEFKNRTVFRMGLTEMEAQKMFDAIDFDGNGSISTSEFVSALSMSEPSLFHEDLRKKVRQRFRSIRDAFTIAMEDFANADLLHEPPPRLPFSRFEVLLKEMDLKQEELRILFDLIDANKENQMTINQFTQGLRHFAPSCVLEDLRLQCLQMNDLVTDAFVGIGVDRLQQLDLDNFTAALERKGLAAGVDIEHVFSLLDTKSEGFVTIGKLIAALQAGGPGNHMRKPSEERDLQATQEVKGHLSGHFKYIGDLKNQVRTSPHGPEPGQLPRQASPERDSANGEAPTTPAGKQNPMTPMSSTNKPPESPGSRRSKPVRLHKSQSGAVVAMGAQQAWSGKKAGNNGKMSSPKTGGQDGQKAAPGAGGPNSEGLASDEVPELHATSAPRIRPPAPEELAKYMAKLDPSRIQEHKKIAPDPIVGAQKSWGNLWDCLHKSPDAKERFEVEKELLQYYQKATKTVAHDVPLLERSHSRHAAYKSARAHTRALARSS